MTLLQVEKNVNYTIRKINGDEQQRRRLFDMGVVQGRKFFVAEFSPDGTAVLIRFDNFSVAIRADLADGIEVAIA